MYVWIILTKYAEDQYNESINSSLRKIKGKLKYRGIYRVHEPGDSIVLTAPQTEL
jgi:hypothetical protein